MKMMMMLPKSSFCYSFLLLLASIFFSTAQSKCSKSCGLAFASYYVWEGTNLTFISEMLRSRILPENNFEPIMLNNKQIPNKDLIHSGTRINVPFPCDCINGDFLGQRFVYNVRSGDQYETVANQWYSNLTSVDQLQRDNSYPATNIPDTGMLNVTVNCSCGDEKVSKEYGLFITYPLRPSQSLNSVASEVNLSANLLQRYNPGVDFNSGSGLVFIPGKDANGTYPPLNLSSSGGMGAGVVAGICIGVAILVISLGCLLYYGVYRRRQSKKAMLLSAAAQDFSANGSVNTIGKPSSRLPGGLSGISVDKSVEFSYEELAQETENFSLANKIGEGGFGAVYYAELRGEKAAIKKMDMQATKQFLAELNVLTRVHHVNLVRLIGYCVEGSLFLVYEFIENGTLSQHLRRSGKEPLPWSKRVQIALDSARGLEYIHEHTVPVYIHRDIKSANILIDNNFHAKVADFGLARLTEVGTGSVRTHAVGTFGYMPPEYAYGEISAKVDVYAFGVVLYELISGKDAIVRATQPGGQHKGLVGLFDEVFSEPDPTESLRRLVDPNLESDYPFDTVYKMAELAKACTQDNPQLRPGMRYVVVALTTLTSSTGNWDVGAFFENEALANLMSGR